MPPPVPGEPRISRGGCGWLALIALPPAVIALGLVGLFVWEGSRGAVTPKWRKPAATNAVEAITNQPGSASGSPRR